MKDTNANNGQLAGKAEITPDISIVLPVYNEAESIRGVIRELHGVLNTMPSVVFEIVAVNDGSSDGTLDILKGLATELNGIKIVSLVRNSGQSAAFVAGFRQAAGSVIVAMDADGQNDPNDIPGLLEELKKCDCVCGYRAKRMDCFAKRLGSRVANAVRNAVLGEDIIDTGCSLKVFRTELVRDFPSLNGMHRFIPSYLMMKGALIRQLPVNHRPRMLGKSKYTNLGRLAKTVRDLMAVKWMKSRYRNYTMEAV